MFYIWILGKRGQQVSWIVSFPKCHHDEYIDHEFVSSFKNHRNGTLIAIMTLIWIGLGVQHGNSGLCGHEQLACNFGPSILSITRLASQMRMMTITCIAISIIIARCFVSRTMSQQATGLTIIVVSEFMTMAGTPHNVIAFNRTVATEVFRTSKFV